MRSLVGLGFHPPPGWPKCWVFCLSVCLFVRHAFERQSYAPDFAMKTLEYRNDFDELDRGRFVVVHPRSTFSDCRQLTRHHKIPKSKNDKNWGFSPPKGDRINRSRRNLARKRIPWVCSGALKLAFIGKRGSVQELPNVKIFPKLWFLATGSRRNEHIQMKFGV